MNDQILQEISEFCRQRGLAESTFGRRAVNDGKLANRLRNGGRITTDTLERIRSFMARNADAAPARRRVLFDAAAARGLPVVTPPAPPVASGQAANDPQRNFRFFDNRQKYLLFVNTCSREMGNRATRRHGARQYPSAPAGGARVRRRPRRRHRAGARHAQYARPLSRPCRSISSARKSASRTSASRCTRWPTVSSSIPRPCWCSPISPMPKRPGSR